VVVPIANFRVAQAREFAETYTVPPPATLYGMLLSLVGEADRRRHIGAAVALAMMKSGERSVVLRTMRRVKSKKTSTDPENARPDYQELLTGLDLIVWVSAGSEEGQPLVDRVQTALAGPHSVVRFGGLSLGESRNLIDEVRSIAAESPLDAEWLMPDENGALSLPVWVDHVGSRGTRFLSYQLRRCTLIPAEAEVWTTICPPE